MIPEKNKQNLLTGGLFGRHELIEPAKKSKFKRTVGTQIKEEFQRAAEMVEKTARKIIK